MWRRYYLEIILAILELLNDDIYIKIKTFK